MSNAQRVDLYVPRDARVQMVLGILPASAIVGTKTDGDRIVVDFEGNKHGAVNLKKYEGRVEVAVGRHLTEYPTTARRSVALEEVVRVGSATYFPEYGTVVTEIDEPEALAEWLGSEPLPAINGSAEMRGRFAAKALRRMSSSEQIDAHLKASTTGQSLIDLLMNRILSEEP